LFLSHAQEAGGLKALVAIVHNTSMSCTEPLNGQRNAMAFSGHIS
jgi:hypothetical protein